AASAMPASEPTGGLSMPSSSSDGAAGCTKIYREKVTGAHNDRRELLTLLNRLAPGDVVTVTRIDRLARSTFDLFAIVKRIADAKAQFRSLAEPWADTWRSRGPTPGGAVGRHRHQHRALDAGACAAPHVTHDP
ncbi:MAG: recombinase family protein, partial [Stellaceae bacterium]